MVSVSEIDRCDFSQFRNQCFDNFKIPVVTIQHIACHKNQIRILLLYLFHQFFIILTKLSIMQVGQLYNSYRIFEVSFYCIISHGQEL